VRCYLPVRKCFQQEPLELEADVWALLERRPNTYALIVTMPDGQPVELTGSALGAMRERGEVTLHPARYRIVHESRDGGRDTYGAAREIGVNQTRLNASPVRR
jgi:hypothetical protein